jgi:protein KRI1
MKTIESIRNKDPKIYDSKTKWYQSDEEESEEEEKEEEQRQKKGTKKKTYKDILREQLLSGGADDNPSHSKMSTLQYDQEQEALRKSFLTSANEIVSSASEASDGDEDDGDDLFVAAQKTPQVLAQEENELKEAIAKYAKSDRATEEDVFLANYMKEKKWVDPLAKTLKASSKKSLSLDQEDELLDLEEDEQELIEIDKFESKYNFRFEEMQNGPSIFFA